MEVTPESLGVCGAGVLVSVCPQLRDILRCSVLGVLTRGHCGQAPRILQVLGLFAVPGVLCHLALPTEEALTHGVLL